MVNYCVYSNGKFYVLHLWRCIDVEATLYLRHVPAGSGVQVTKAYFNTACSHVFLFTSRVDPDLWCMILVCTVFSGLYLRFFIGKYDALANELVKCHFSLPEPMPRSKTMKMAVSNEPYTLRKHAYSNILKILSPKKWKFSHKKFLYFTYFWSKHRLWVLVRTASTRRF